MKFTAVLYAFAASVVAGAALSIPTVTEPNRLIKRENPTIINFNEKFLYSHTGVHRNDEAVLAGIKAQVATSVFEALKLWENTRTVHIQGLTAKVHDHGWERIAEILSVNITEAKTHTSKKNGKSKWEWHGGGECAIQVKSYAETS